MPGADSLRYVLTEIILKRHTRRCGPPVPRNFPSPPGSTPCSHYLAGTSGVRLEADGGVVVNEYLQACPNVYVAGDIASFPYRAGGAQPTGAHSSPATSPALARVRIENWNVAVQQGRVAARNMLGHNVPYSGVPFFWTQQYGLSLRLVGHAPVYDAVLFQLGDPRTGRSWVAYFVLDGSVAAVCTLGKDPFAAAALELFRLGKMPSASDLSDEVDLVHYLQLTTAGTAAGDGDGAHEAAVITAEAGGADDPVPVPVPSSKA